ncbi:MAG TPA: F390 synthetase-related protein [Allosphingosinicella sp.]|jgi:putative adenylate-forming enzyme|nr:F390 synthetase-related protein [Allosphingosinicella sp.]
MLDVAHAAAAFVRTRALRATLRSRPAIERHQRRACARLVSDARATIPYYRDKGPEFEDLPIVDKAIQQARFDEFNRPGITLDEAVEALAAGRDTVRGCFVGQSTGTSGNRGRFVISPAERFAWLGTIVAKAVPDALFRRRRVALALPGFSALYKSASSGSRIRLAFFDLALGVEAWRGELAAFAPEVLVAPPKVLRRLAEDGALGGVEPFSGAEVLDPIDREVIERSSGRRVREIYMATEGLFGVGCRHGTLHLAEDAVRFEWEAVPGSELVVPIVTDMVRRVQPMIRYRMNDLLELSGAGCPCGSPYRAVARIHGRMDDVFEFDTPRGRAMVTPDVLRNAVIDADGRIRDFRIIQKRDGTVAIELDEGLPDEVHAAVASSAGRALARLGAAPLVTTSRGIAPRFDRKLRRVERERG